MAGFFVPGIARRGPYIVKTYREPPADCARANQAPGPPRWARDPWPVYRTPGPLGRGPWPPGARAVARGPRAWWRATWCAPWCAWSLGRGPRSWPPGGRSLAPGACALVAAGRGACALVRGTWCAAAGARSGSPGRWRAAPVPAPGPKKCARSMAARASARFYAISAARNSFPVPRKQAPFAKNSISACNFSWNKYNSFHENNVLKMWSAQRPPAPAVLPRVPCCVRQGPSPTARGPAS